MPPRRIWYAELHSHVGGATPAADLWEIAHLEGIRLPTRSYEEFERLVSAQGRRLAGVTDLAKGPYAWTELIQSSPLAIERAVYRALTSAYRASGVVVHELRFNPAKRNRGGERDLDHIITAALRGMERAQLEFPLLRAGIIISLDRTFPLRLNEVLVEKACRYRDRGVVGIDIAGPQHPRFRLERLFPLFREARKCGLGITVHTGEEGGLAEMMTLLEEGEVQRIGHGVRAWRSPEACARLRERGVVLEVCPSSNMALGVFNRPHQLCAALERFFRAGVTVTINTDGPEMYGTSLPQEFMRIKRWCGWSAQRCRQVRQAAFRAAFVRE